MNQYESAENAESPVSTKTTHTQSDTSAYRKKCSSCGQYFHTNFANETVCQTCREAYRLLDEISNDELREGLNHIKEMHDDIHVIKNIVLTYFICSIVAIIIALLSLAN